MIDSIQDYSNRLNLIPNQNIDKYKKLSEEIDKNSNSKKLNFKDLVNEEVNSKITGKISSSSIQKPNNIKEEIAVDPYKKKLYNASVEFESIFVKLMLKEMKKTIEKTGLIDGGYAEEIFEDMLYDEYSKDISKNSSLGMAEQIYLSLSANLPDSSKK